MAARRRPLLALAAGLLVSAAAIWILSASVDVAAASTVLAGARIERLLPVTAILALQFVVRTFRWSRLAVALRTDPPLPVARFAGPLAIGYLGNAVLPARLGEVLRAAVLGRAEGVPVAAVLGTVLVERIVDTLTLAALAGVVAAIVAPGWIAGLATFVAVAAVAVLIGLVTIGRAAARTIGAGTNPRLEPLSTIGGGAVRDVANAVDRIPHRALAVAVALSVVAWLCDGALFWTVSWSVGVDVAPATAFLVAAVTVLATAVPASPGYVGTFEAAAVGAGVALGIAPGNGLAIAVLAHACATIPLAGLGGIAALRLGLRRSDVTAARGGSPAVVAVR
ncbi:MAG: lysylphosphatidylglycerol synthase transmembrane domain-containing protein [Chloroflexota bacterium]